MTTIQQLIDKHKVQILPQGAEDWEIVCREVAKDYAYDILREVLKDLRKYNRPRAGGQDGCVGVREQYGETLIKLVEEYTHKLEEQ